MKFNNEKNMRFSLRKLTIGLVSVGIGLFFTGVKTNDVYADENITGSNTEEIENNSNSNTDSTGNSTQEKANSQTQNIKSAQATQAQQNKSKDELNKNTLTSSKDSESVKNKVESPIRRQRK